MNSIAVLVLISSCPLQELFQKECTNQFEVEVKGNIGYNVIWNVGGTVP
jgi:hypothetical protein